MRKKAALNQNVPLFVPSSLAEFHPNLIGLTGTNEAVREAARAYRVYYMKTEEEGADYLVDHSIVMYVLHQLV